MQEERSQRLGKPFLLMGSVLLIVLFFLLLNYDPMRQFCVRDTAGTVGFTENPWLFQEPGAAHGEEIQLPHHRKLEKGKVYTLSAVLTYDGSQDRGPSGFLHLDHIFCRVSLDNTVLFSCLPEDAPVWGSVKSPGFIFKVFPLPNDCKGRVLKIELLPEMDTQLDYVLPDIRFGDLTASLHAGVLRDMPHNVIVVLCVLLGVCSILFSSVALQGTRCREGIFVGLFSLVFSVYLITECELDTYFIGNPYYLYLKNYIAFSLLPITLLAFMRERILPKHRKTCGAFIAVETAFVALECVLHFSGVWELRQFIPFVHVMYFSDMVLVVFCVGAIREKRKKHSLIAQVIPVLAGMIVDACIYWFHLEWGSNDATFTILGVVFFLIIEVLHVCRSSVYIYGESVRSRLYRQMAFVDELTEVGNRRAFDREIDAVTSGEREYTSMIVVSCDVNRLKYVNDHYGHGAGDKLIRSAAQILAQIFADRGRVFRTGGDEFSAFLYDVSISQYERLMQDVQERVDTFNAENAFPMSLAVGYEEIFDHQVLKAAKEADRKMYEDKVRSKMRREDMPE